MSLNLRTGDLVQVYSSDGKINVFNDTSEDYFGEVVGKIKNGETGLVLARISDHVMDPRFHYYKVLFKESEIVGMVFGGFLIRIAGKD